MRGLGWRRWALVLVVAGAALTFTVVRLVSSAAEREVRPTDPGAPGREVPQEPHPISGVTAPGSELTIGQTARVPVKHLRRGAVELTVTGIRPGDRDAILSAPGLDPSLALSARRGDFWYVDVTIGFLEGRIGGYYLDPDTEPVVENGRKLGRWVMGHDFAPCRPRGLPLHPHPGDTVRDCLIFQTRPGAEVVGLAWGPYRSSYDVAEGLAVTWR